jgi:N-methylhydantoinase B
MNGTRRPAVDVGGTFTDVVELQAGRLRVDKVPTTLQAPTEGGSYNRLDAGEVLVNDTGGGGCFGDPFTREPERVARDVRNGFVSVRAAARDYGVVVDAGMFTVDAAATALLRERAA